MGAEIVEPVMAEVADAPDGGVGVGMEKEEVLCKGVGMEEEEAEVLCKELVAAENWAGEENRREMAGVDCNREEVEEKLGVGEGNVGEVGVKGVAGAKVGVEVNGVVKEGAGVRKEQAVAANRGD